MLYDNCYYLKNLKNFIKIINHLSKIFLKFTIIK